jgi:hypothetical protein
MIIYFSISKVLESTWCPTVSTTVKLGSKFFLNICKNEKWTWKIWDQLEESNSSNAFNSANSKLMQIRLKKLYLYFINYTGSEFWDREKVKLKVTKLIKHFVLLLNLSTNIFPISVCINHLPIIIRHNSVLNHHQNVIGNYISYLIFIYVLEQFIFSFNCNWS